MIERTYDPELVGKAVSQYKENVVGFHPKEWLEHSPNIAIATPEGDVALFEEVFPGVYSGHYFFFVRGKMAIKLSKEILKKVFTEYNVKVIRGMTPLENLGARWMNKKLGFSSYGVVHNAGGPEELVILTRENWEKMNG